MNDSISTAIITMVSNDPTASDAEKQGIEAICKGKVPQKRKKLILRKDVLSILGVSEPTLRKYIQRGYLPEIKLSCRKSRFDYEQVMLFAEQGVREFDTHANGTTVRHSTPYTLFHGERSLK